MYFPRVIYALRHEPTGKVYVGSTHKIVNRVQNHINQLKRHAHPNAAMQADFDHFGGEYTVLILDSAHGMDDKNKEILWMDALQARDPERGYNGQEPTRATALIGIAGIRYPMEAGDERIQANKAVEEAARAAMD